jgi:1,4-dihydroxy-2-naphthoate octaprenyltransferase
LKENLKDLVTREPALVVGLVTAFLGMLSAFGLALTQEQVAAVVAFVGAVLAFAGFLYTRGEVTPYRPPGSRGKKDDLYRR